MSVNKLPKRVSDKKVATLFRKIDRANQSDVPSTPQPRENHYAGWNWEDGADPYLQAES